MVIEEALSVEKEENERGDVFLQPIFSIATLSKVDYHHFSSVNKERVQEITVKKKRKLLKSQDISVENCCGMGVAVI